MKTFCTNLVAWIDDDHNKKKVYVLQGAILLFYLLFFYVIAESGYTADDMYNSNAHGLAYIQGASVWELTHRAYMSWLQVGRFFPFSDYVYIMFYYVTSRLAYKLMVIAAIYINCILFYKCIHKITHSTAAAMFTLVFFPMCMQLTGEYDSAFYCFHMLIQFTFIWTLLSLYCVLKYVDCIEKKRQGQKTWLKYVYLLLSGVFLFVALGTYEVAFVLVIFIGIGVWAYTRSFKSTCKVLIPDFIAFGIVAIINVYLRMHVTNIGYDGIAINLNPVVVGKTFLKQVLSTLPLNRLIFRTILYGPPYSRSDLLGNLRWTDFIMVVVFVLILWAVTRMIKQHANQVKNQGFLIWGGISLLVLPALLIAITTKYQEILDWGMSHISCYIQSFGLVLICMCIYSLIIKRSSEKVVRIIMVIVMVISIPVMLLQEMESRTSVFYVNQSHRYPLENIQNAANLGVFEEIEPQDDVFGRSDYYYDQEDSKAFYSKYAKREVSAYGRGYAAKEIETWSDDYLKNHNAFTVQSEAQMLEGYVVVSHINNFVANDISKGDYSLYVDRIKIYVNFPGDFTVRYQINGVEMSTSSTSLLQVKQGENANEKIFELDNLNTNVDTIEIIR